MRIVMLFISFILTFTTVKAQQTTAKKNTDSTATLKPTKAKDTGYVNKGRVAGKIAIRRSLIFPGLGQIYNYGLVVDDVKSGFYKDKRVLQKIYIVGKIGLIYGGGYALVSAYIDNNNKYKRFLTELQYRQANNGASDPNGGLELYENTNNLVIAKNIYKNNREVVLISLVALYGANIIDAYVTARLKYHSVDTDLTYKISPTIINTGTMYGFQPAPGLKLTLKL